MQRMVSFLLVAVMVMVALPHAGSVKCYSCTGYISSESPDHNDNNKYCPQNNFSPSQVSVQNGLMCETLVEEYRGQEVTVRTPVPSSKMTKAKANYINVRGYFCATDYCNGKDPGAAPPTRTICLPLLLVSLLVVLPRCLP